jgi:uncharacterized membrane protein
MEEAPVAGLSAHRIEALTDGIYAVAMTLLVIDLKLPEHASFSSTDELGNALAELLPRFMAWAMSFFVLAFFWIGHHRVYSHVRRNDMKLLWFNIIQLAFVSLMPFSCDLLGEHGRSLLSQLIYSTNMVLLAGMALLISHYTFVHPELSAVPMPLAHYRGARMRISGLIVISIAAVILAAFVPWPGAGSMAFGLMAIITPLSRRLERKAALTQPA